MYKYFSFGVESMIKAVVFDLDHTLLDRYETLRQVVPSFRERFKLTEGITDEFIAEKICWADKQYVHNGWQQILAYLCENNIFAFESFGILSRILSIALETLRPFFSYKSERLFISDEIFKKSR